MGVGRGDPEPEDDRDVREERERVPVVDRLVQAPDALVLRERGHGLRDESPHQCRTDDDGEHPRRETSRGCTPERRHREPEPEECRVRDGLVEDVPAPIGDDRPPDRRRRARRRGARTSRAGRRRSGRYAERGFCRARLRRGPPSTGRLHRHRPAASRARPSRHRRTSRLRATPPRGLRGRGRRPRNGARTAPTPSPWRATLAPGPGFHARGKVAARVASGGESSNRHRPREPTPAGSVTCGSRRSWYPTPPTKAGYGDCPSNNSFTLPTPPAHPVGEDSAIPGLFRPSP